VTNRETEVAADEPESSAVKIVVDTNLFTNPDVARQWGDTTANACKAFLSKAREVAGLISFYMPPSIFSELRHFLGETTDLGEFELVVTIQSPNRYNVSVPGFLLYELIDEIRERINKGLRVAEKAVREARPEFLAEGIQRLREEYRGALRAGLLDSKEDVDLLLLAHELKAAIVSSDRGVVQVADKLGLRLIRPENLRTILERSIEYNSAIQ
jgi:RNA ligase partner protein